MQFFKLWKQTPRLPKTNPYEYQGVALHAASDRLISLFCCTDIKRGYLDTRGMQGGQMKNHVGNPDQPHQLIAKYLFMNMK